MANPKRTAVADVTHTPGPWQLVPPEGRHDTKWTIRMGTALLDEEGDLLGGPHTQEVQHITEIDHCLYPDDGAQYAESLANIRLMTSSPMLLAACVVAATVLEAAVRASIKGFSPHMVDVMVAKNRALKQLRDAIAIATTGKAS